MTIRTRPIRSSRRQYWITIPKSYLLYRTIRCQFVTVDLGWPLKVISAILKLPIVKIYKYMA